MIVANLDGFISLDWGFNAPFAAYWWLCLPDGRYHIRREWKQRETYAEDFAKGCWQITREEMGWIRPRYVVAGGDIKSRTGLKGPKGESVYDVLASYGLPMRDADRDRINGWYRVHELLRPSPYGTPWLTVDPSCTYLIRTIAAAPRDPHEDDEIDPKFSDDHGLESVRYGAMSRPSPTRVVAATRIGDVGRLRAELLASQAPGILGASAVRRY